jgi:hypothetical protein
MGNPRRGETVSKTPEGDPGYLALLDEMRSLHTRKSAGYTGTDPDAWRNFREATRWGVSPFVGALVRLSDKYLRVGSLVENAKHDQVGESIEDTLMDLAAYALIALCLYREERPVVPTFKPADYWDDGDASLATMPQDAPEYEDVEPFEADCWLRRCIKTDHPTDPNTHEDWAGTFYEDPFGLGRPAVGHLNLHGDV